MQVTIDISKELEEALRAEWGDLDEAAKDALIIESYRTGRLSIGQVAEILGFDTRTEAESWLGGRGVNWNYTLDELEADRQTLDRLFREKS